MTDVYSHRALVARPAGRGRPGAVLTSFGPSVLVSEQSTWSCVRFLSFELYRIRLMDRKDRPYVVVLLEEQGWSGSRHSVPRAVVPNQGHQKPQIRAR